MLQAWNNHFVLLDVHGEVNGFVGKKAKFSSESNLGQQRLQRREFTSAIYICHEFSLVAFENSEQLLMTPAVIYNNCNPHKNISEILL